MGFIPRQTKEGKNYVCVFSCTKICQSSAIAEFCKKLVSLSDSKVSITCLCVSVCLPALINCLPFVRLNYDLLQLFQISAFLLLQYHISPFSRLLNLLTRLTRFYEEPNRFQPKLREKGLSQAQIGRLGVQFGLICGLGRCDLFSS